MGLLHQTEWLAEENGGPTWCGSPLRTGPGHQGCFGLRQKVLWEFKRMGHSLWAKDACRACCPKFRELSLLCIGTLSSCKPPAARWLLVSVHVKRTGLSAWSI